MREYHRRPSANKGVPHEALFKVCAADLFGVLFQYDLEGAAGAVSGATASLG